MATPGIDQVDYSRAVITAAVPQNLGETFANPYRNEDTVLLRLDTVAVIERKVVSWKRRV